MRRALAAVILAAGLWAGLPGTAWAHATLVEATPASGTVVVKPPGQVELRFDDQIRPVEGGTDVVGSDGESVLGGAPERSPDDVTVLVVPLKDDLPDGDYTVRWEVVSSDGHLLSGVFAFGLGAGRPPPQAAVESGSNQDWRYLAARTSYFIGLLLLVGGAAFRLAVFLPVVRGVGADRRRMMELREHHRANQVLAGSAALALGGGWIALTLQGAAVAGVSFWEAFDHRGPVASAIEATRFGREFSRGIDVTAAFTLLAAAAYALAGRRPRLALAVAVPTAVLGVWALAAPGIAGHAGDPGRGTPAIVLDVVHVAAAAVWAGGLLQLFWVTPHATRGLPDGERERVRAAIARRFSTIALGSVVLLVVSGTLRAVYEFDSVSELWTIAYGRTLLLKVALLAVLIGFGIRNRRLLERFRPLRRSVGAELGVLAAVVAAVALLTNLSPGVTGSAPAAETPTGGPVDIALRGGGRLAVWPGLAGTNGVLLRLPRATGAASVLVTGERGGLLRTVPLERLGPGVWGGLIPGVPEGTAQVQVSVGSRTRAASVQVGPARVNAAPAPNPGDGGPLAAGQAGDVAVALQRVGGRRMQVTLMDQEGSAVDDALVLVDGRPATPCTHGPAACYLTAIGSGRGKHDVQVVRSGRPEVIARIDLPAAAAPAAAGVVDDTVRAWEQLASLEASNVLASGPGRRVITQIVVQAPNRLALDVVGGASTRVIGDQRWDRDPGGQWMEREAVPVRVPDPFWAERPVAAYVLGRSAAREDITLGYWNGSPTWYRLVVDRATDRVLQVRMIASGHFMTELYDRFDTAPPVVPPA